MLLQHYDMETVGHRREPFFDLDQLMYYDITQELDVAQFVTKIELTRAELEKLAAIFISNCPR